MEQDRKSPCRQRVRRPWVNSTTKQANVIIMGITFRGSTECHSVVKKGDYQAWYQLNMRSLIMNRDIPGVVSNQMGWW